MRKPVWIGIVLGVVLLALLPIVRSAERSDVRVERETRAPGALASLTDGTVHYQMAGPADSQTVVLVHGFSVPSYVWDPTFDALVDAGFRVVRYDLYGRGYSDRPDAVYDRELFVRQLRELLDSLRVSQPVDVVGLSMGGAVAAAFAADHPARVGRLVLMAPSHAPQEIGPLGLPAVGEYLNRVYFVPSLPGSQLKDFAEPERFPAWADRYREQMQYRGFARAILSTVRNFATRDPMPDLRKVASQGTPVLLVWGEEDRTVPFVENERVRAALRDALFLPVPRAGHLPHLERPDLVNPVLVEFLRSTRRMAGGGR